MIKHQRRGDVEKCFVHKAIKQECITQLINLGSFSKEDVLKAVGAQAVSESIRWDFLREMIEDETKLKLLPVASRFFHRRSAKHNPKGFVVDINPGAFLASGWQKKTAGFVSVEVRNGALVTKAVALRSKIADGVNGAVRKLANSAREHGALNASPPADVLENKQQTLPPL